MEIQTLKNFEAIHRDNEAVKEAIRYAGYIREALEKAREKIR